MTVEATADTAGFREVLHRWALAKLKAGCTDHTGPFEVLQVRLHHTDFAGSDVTPADDTVTINIRFRHHGCTAYTWDGHPECTVEWWSPSMRTTDTVTLLNELLATADGR